METSDYGVTAGVVDLTMDTALVIANGLEIAKNAFGYSTWCPYFPMQKVEKIRLRRSSVVVVPVSVSRAASAA